MSTDLPPMALGYDDDGSPVVIVETATVSTIEALLQLVPAIAVAPHAVWAANAVNHFAYEQTFTVIEDPAEFKSWFMKRWAEEDPNFEWDENLPQLHNFGMPALDEISAPVLAGGELVFYVVNRQLGAPSRVTATASSDGFGPPAYDPVDMTPDPASQPFPVEQTPINTDDDPATPTAAGD